LAFESENERVRLKALDVYYRAVAIRKSHQKIEKRESGPGVYLPPIRDYTPEEKRLIEEHQASTH
jgi:hypothetical protein